MSKSLYFSRQWEQLSHFSMFNPMAMQKPNLFSPSIGMNGTGVGLPFPLPLPQTGLRTSYPSPDAQDRDMARKSPDKTKQMVSQVIRCHNPSNQLPDLYLFFWDYSIKVLKHKTSSCIGTRNSSCACVNLDEERS